MRQHGEELVLAPVRLLRRLIQPRVVDGGRDAMREVFRQRLRSRVVSPQGLRGREPEDAVVASARRDRYHERRPQPERLQALELPHVRRERAERLRVDGLGEARNAVGGGRGVGQRNVAQRSHRLPDRLVARERESRRTPIRGDVDRADVGDARHQQLRHRRQRAVVVERACEDGARLGQHAQRLLDAPMLCDVGRDGDGAGEGAVSGAERRRRAHHPRRLRAAATDDAERAAHRLAGERARDAEVAERPRQCAEPRAVGRRGGSRWVRGVRPLEQLARGGILAHDPPVGIGDHHRIGNLLEHEGQLGTLVIDAAEELAVLDRESELLGAPLEQAHVVAQQPQRGAARDREQHADRSMPRPDRHDREPVHPADQRPLVRRQRRRVREDASAAVREDAAHEPEAPRSQRFRHDLAMIGAKAARGDPA